MKARSSRGQTREVSVIVRRADASCQNRLVVAIPDAGADLDAVERALIAFALDRTGGNRTRAARFLGLSRSALIYRMHKHGLVSDTGRVEQAV